MFLNDLEDKEQLTKDRQRISQFQQEINKVFDNNLDNCLINFINNVDWLKVDSDIAYWLSQYNKFIKQSLK